MKTCSICSIDSKSLYALWEAEHPNQPEKCQYAYFLCCIGTGPYYCHLHQLETITNVFKNTKKTKKTTIL